MRQTKEDKAAYRTEDQMVLVSGVGSTTIAGFMFIKDGRVMYQERGHEAKPLADITISEDNTVTITPVSETKSSHETN